MGLMKKGRIPPPGNIKNTWTSKYDETKIGIRFREAEKLAIQRAALQEGVSTAVFCRTILLDHIDYDLPY